MRILLSWPGGEADWGLTQALPGLAGGGVLLLSGALARLLRLGGGLGGGVGRALCSVLSASILSGSGEAGGRNVVPLVRGPRKGGPPGLFASTPASH